MRKEPIEFSSAMKRKAFILLPFLILFLLLISLLSSISVNEFRIEIETETYLELDVYSLVEIETIRQVKAQFKSFKPTDFSYKAGEWFITVRFEDETAYIEYEGSDIIHSILIYDMVFENVLDYVITDADTSDSD